MSLSGVFRVPFVVVGYILHLEVPVCISGDVFVLANELPFGYLICRWFAGNDLFSVH